MIARTFGDFVLRRSPVQLLARARSNRRLRVLCYHDVGSATAFRRQLEVCARQLSPVSLDEVTRAANDESELPRRAVLITFDDGHRSQMEVAMPELDNVGIQAAFFLVMGHLDTGEPFWWEAVRARRHALRDFPLHGSLYGDSVALERAMKLVSNEERIEALERLDALYGPAPRIQQIKTSDAHLLIRKGHSIGNHSMSHPLLDSCNDQTLVHEVDDSTTRFAELFPSQERVFAYPNGNFDQRVLQRLAAKQYRAAFCFDHAVSGVGQRFMISRLRVSDRLSTDRFESILSGAHSWAHHLRARFRPGPE